MSDYLLISRRTDLPFSSQIYLLISPCFTWNRGKRPKVQMLLLNGLKSPSSALNASTLLSEFYSALANKILCHLGTVELWSAGDWPVFLAEIRKKSKTKRPGLRHIIYLLERSFWVSFRFYGGLPGLLDRVWLQATGRRVGNDKDWMGLIPGWD